MTAETSAKPLLGPDDPDPVEVLNPAGRSPYFITCEHSGRRIPASLGDLGLAPHHMERHIAWDIGAAGLARGLARALDAVVVMQRFSRLVIDCNRPLTVADSIPEESDGTAIPMNRNLSPEARQVRGEAIHRPYHQTIQRLLDERARAGRETYLIALHSFTPSLDAAPRWRPWDLGLLYNRDPRLSTRIGAALADQTGDLNVAHNEPYEVCDLSDFTVPVHGEGRGLQHSLFEVRNDHIAGEAGQRHWAQLLGAVLTRVAQTA